jgi:SAM-dependent methyltransferase
VSLELTGERTVPGVDHENYWFQRHVIAYQFAATRSVGRRVLDAGCGEGYGAALLTGTASSVTGIDLVADVIAHARTAYPHVEFVQADLCALPLADATVDTVVSLQVIEHLPDVGGYLDEVARVLRPGGEFVCATPNRLTFTPDSATPVNPFHVKEFAPEELRDTLSSRFNVESMLGVHHGDRLRTVEREAGRTFMDLVLDTDPSAWEPWLRQLVVSVRPDDFEISSRNLEASLDLLAVATRP